MRKSKTVDSNSASSVAKLCVPLRRECHARRWMANGHPPSRRALKIMLGWTLNISLQPDVNVRTTERAKDHLRSLRQTNIWTIHQAFPRQIDS